MKKKVHYFSFYLSAGMEKQRDANQASFAKMEYVKSTVVESGAELNLVSTAIANIGEGFLGKKVVEVSKTERHIYLPTFRYRGKVFNVMTILFMWLQIVLYIIFNVRKNDQVLIYHSLLYVEPFKLLRKVKKFKLILELNDLYHVVSKDHAHKKDKELGFIGNADAYLFMNILAEKRFNNGKPHVISYGNYELPKRYKDKSSDDGKIHVVYAGIIENGRKAAELSVQSCVYLDENFIMHILGFGDQEQLNIFNEVVNRVNGQKGYEAVIFHGTLRGKEFSDFLHSCHIGVSSHAYLPDEMDSANYTFPSKIPTYMSHDLFVVSPDIPCVVNSPFSEYTTFYHEHTPRDIAQAITECAKVIKEKPVRTPSRLIAEMDDSFHEDIIRVLM